MTWRCRHCDHETIWWKGACGYCGLPLYGERTRVRFTVRRVPVLDTGIGKALGYENDRALMRAGAEQRERALALLSNEERARVEAMERELDRRVLYGDGA